MESHKIPWFQTTNQYISNTIWLFSIAGGKIHSKWRFLAGKIICKWAIFHSIIIPLASLPSSEDNMATLPAELTTSTCQKKATRKPRSPSEKHGKMEGWTVHLFLQWAKHGLNMIWTWFWSSLKWEQDLVEMAIFGHLRDFTNFQALNMTFMHSYNKAKNTHCLIIIVPSRLPQTHFLGKTNCNVVNPCKPNNKLSKVSTSDPPATAGQPAPSSNFRRTLNRRRVRAVSFTTLT